MYQPFSFEEARNQIETELCKPIEELFATYDEKQIATASIGQVYNATLKTGEEVVVKVQRPNVAQIIQKDIDLMYTLARLAENQIPDLKLFDPTGIIREFEKAVKRELDYSHELRNALRFAEAFKYHDQIKIPKVYKELSGKKVFTMERIKGIKITRAEEIGCDKKLLAKIALNAILYMVFDNGFFHADPHPGNIFALPGNTIAFIDLGMVGFLDEAMRDKMAELVIALNTRDHEGVARSLYNLGKKTQKVDFEQFKKETSEVLQKIEGLPLKEIQFSEILNELIQGAKKNKIKIPNDYTLMGKAILTIEGIGRTLDPDLDLEKEAQPFVLKLIKKRWSAQRLGQDFLKSSLQFYQWSREVPGQMISLLNDFENGDIKLKHEDVGQEKYLKIWEEIIQKLTSGLVISSLIISSAIFIISTKETITIYGVPITMVLGIGGYIFAGILGLRIIKSVKFRD
ncbi:MAG: 2-octaprenyl-3-methyl-6-methoxy-1,4-benzoquinone hydroxylase [Candidatus Sericytochromatia bacterium]|nr:MAG: 2-octaprenyl-3-methyl-6-methoxy-1,4-benzoquinone hydroxylase [Candidatus Sericytochromatia bacterium]